MQQKYVAGGVFVRLISLKRSLVTLANDLFIHSSCILVARLIGGTFTEGFHLIDYGYCFLDIDILLEYIQPTKPHSNFILLQKSDRASSKVIINLHYKLISQMWHSQKLYCKKWSIVGIMKMLLLILLHEMIWNRC